jgi:hypothetical protein
MTDYRRREWLGLMIAALIVVIVSLLTNVIRDGSIMVPPGASIVLVPSKGEYCTVVVRPDATGPVRQISVSPELCRRLEKEAANGKR